MKEIDKTLLKILRSDRDDPLALKRAISLGANPNMTVKGDLPILHILAMQGRDTLVKALLAGGAEVDIRDRNGFTALISVSGIGCTPRHHAIMDMLLDSGANIAAKNNDGVTPLEGAINLINFPMANHLMKAGAKPNRDQQQRLREGEARRR
jgi:ankyrin repeat protein